MKYSKHKCPHKRCKLNCGSIRNHNDKYKCLDLKKSDKKCTKFTKKSKKVNYKRLRELGLFVP